MVKIDWENAANVQSNWFKFEKVGDKIAGTLTGKQLQLSNSPGFPDQWVYKISTPEGKVYNVGISVKKQGTVDRLNSCALGDVIGIVYAKDGEPSAKGFKGAKFLEVKLFGKDPDYISHEAGSTTTQLEPDLPEV